MLLSDAATSGKVSSANNPNASVGRENTTVDVSNKAIVEDTINDVRIGIEGSSSGTKDDQKWLLEPPTRRYTKEDKQLKQRVFTCPGCGEGADGSHQCGDCFGHVHVICGTPYDGSLEGFGQLVRCGQCIRGNDDDDAVEMTQV